MWGGFLFEMASLASYTTLYMTAVRVDGPVELVNIAAVRWDGGLGPEDSSVADFIGWLDRGCACLCPWG